jgi:epoxyqueuosine reductase
MREAGENNRGRLEAVKVRVLALQAGFSDAGVVALPYVDEAQEGARYAAWVAAGRAGAMQYMEQRNELGKLLRERAGGPFPWARSAVVCFASYHAEGPLSTAEHEPGAGWIARYAWTSRVDGNGAQLPSDYHKVLKKRLEQLEARLRAELGAEFEARGFVDTGPVLERALARAAGLGWVGKNTCLIHPRLGSFGFLAVLLTGLKTSEVSGDSGVSGVGKSISFAPIPDRCGSCTRCIDACPTEALVGPHELDARRCIAYGTIELKGALDAELMQGMGRQVFGCDICQDVCPWNRKAVAVADPELAPRTELVNPPLEELGELSEVEFEKEFNGSPVRRAGYFGLLRNVAVAMGNSGERRFRERLAGWAEAGDDGLRCAARWALNKLATIAHSG